MWKEPDRFLFIGGYNYFDSRKISNEKAGDNYQE